jgi:hypothetical protein
MPRTLERTCWRGVRVDHPREWEIALAAGVDDPPRCAFADRHYYRLDLRWQQVDHPPNLELLLEKHRQSPKGQLRDVSRLGDLPAGWNGLLRQGENGCVTYAAKVFRDRRVLAEATLFWPGHRDVVLEATVLDSVAPDAAGPVRLWQAMGISLELGQEFKLRSSGASVGRVRWTFATSGREAQTLTVERLAMPDRWLHEPLEAWLVEQRPPRLVTAKSEEATFNGHAAQRLLSRAKGTLGSAIRRRRLRQLDVAWRCEAENRLYHLALSRLSRSDEVELPGSLVVRCCRPVPQAIATEGRS